MFRLNSAHTLIQTSMWLFINMYITGTIKNMTDVVTYTAILLGTGYLTNYVVAYVQPQETINE